MAKRPVFVPSKVAPFVKEVEVEFKWHPGLSKAQAQRSIAELHESASSQNLKPLLEISSKSTTPLGVQLSAFNLQIQTPQGKFISIECAYQGSKVFEQGGPHADLYWTSSKEAKQDGRLRSSGALVAFDFFGQRWPLVPTTAFYDWLYLSALLQHPDFQNQLQGFAGFTDIAFNPEKSAACQARCAAQSLGLIQQGMFSEVLQDQQHFLNAMQGKSSTRSVQPGLF